MSEIDQEQEIVELWYELVKTQAILEKTVGRIEVNGERVLNKKELKECEDIALRSIQTRFPELGVRPK